MTSKRPSPGFDNVAFEFEGARIVGTVLDYDDGGLLIVGNPFHGANYHVPVEDAAITVENITGAGTNE
jgi:hypothetical protein